VILVPQPRNGDVILTADSDLKAEKSVHTFNHTHAHKHAPKTQHVAYLSNT